MRPLCLPCDVHAIPGTWAAYLLQDDASCTAHAVSRHAAGAQGITQRASHSLMHHAGTCCAAILKASTLLPHLHTQPHCQVNLPDTESCLARSLGSSAFRGGSPVEGAQAQRRVAGPLAGAPSPGLSSSGSRVPEPAGSSASRASAPVACEVPAADSSRVVSSAGSGRTGRSHTSSGLAWQHS